MYNPCTIWILLLFFSLSLCRKNKIKLLIFICSDGRWFRGPKLWKEMKICWTSIFFYFLSDFLLEDIVGRLGWLKIWRISDQKHSCLKNFLIKYYLYWNRVYEKKKIETVFIKNNSGLLMINSIHFLMPPSMKKGFRTQNIPILRIFLLKIICIETLNKKKM